MTTFGSTTEDADGVPIGQGDPHKVTPIDRGPPEEMRMTEAELRGDMRLIADAKKSMGELATIEGVTAEMKMLRSMMDDLCEQNERLIGMYQTLKGELDSFKQQWNIERQSWLRNGGSTTPEDS
jgi:hypothetical protein